KVIRGASVQNMESNKSRFDPRENFLRTLPNRVKVVLPCGVIKSIAEKLQQVEDDTTLIEIFVFSSDIYQASFYHILTA
uniref:Uncharacterized protein n=1 Tax=Parascaris univalens TaxID=6257 RepID=A0A915A724_PARUN